MERQDDPKISGSIVLLRRIPPWADRVSWDEQGNPRASSFNFKDDEDELSVHIASETTPDEVLEDHTGFGLVQFTAQEVREACGSGIKLCRCLEESALGHVLVCGKIGSGAAKRLQRAAKWVEGRWPARDPAPPPAPPSGQQT
jgi:hypothetical protein